MKNLYFPEKDPQNKRKFHSNQVPQIGQRQKVVIHQRSQTRQTVAQ